MSDEERPRCTTCGGLGAVVERYTFIDKDGYEIHALRDKPCTACGGTGRQ